MDEGSLLKLQIEWMASSREECLLVFSLKVDVFHVQ